MKLLCFSLEMSQWVFFSSLTFKEKEADIAIVITYNYLQNNQLQNIKTENNSANQT